MYNLAKRQFEKQYDSTFEILELTTSSNGPFEESKWQSVAKDIPCRVAKKQQLQSVSDGDVSGINYQLVLYCSNEFDIKAGSKLLVTNYRGETREYKRSGEAFNSYKTHQELAILRSDEA